MRRLARDPVKRAGQVGLLLGRERPAALEAAGGDDQQVAVHHVAGVLHVGGEGEDLGGAAMVRLAHRLAVEPGQIGADGGVQPVEHVVEPARLGDAAAVAAREAVGEAREHALQHVGQPQRLARRRRPAPPSASPAPPRPDSSGRDGSAGSTRAGSRRSQQGGVGGQQREQQGGQHQVEQGVEIGDGAAGSSARSASARRDPGQRRQRRQRADRRGRRGCPPARAARPGSSPGAPSSTGLMAVPILAPSTRANDGVQRQHALGGEATSPAAPRRPRNAPPRSAPRRSAGRAPARWRARRASGAGWARPRTA